MGEFFHDSAIQMQAFIAFAAQKFGINENTSYLCNVNQFDLLSGQNPERARLYRHYPFKRASSEALFVLSQISFHKHFDVAITLYKTT